MTFLKYIWKYSVNKKMCLLMYMPFISSCGSTDVIADYKVELKCPDAISVYVENEKTNVFFSDHGFFLNRNTHEKMKNYSIVIDNDIAFKDLNKKRISLDGGYEAYLSGYYLDKEQCPALDENIFIATSVGDGK